MESGFGMFSAAPTGRKWSGVNRPIDTIAGSLGSFHTVVLVTVAPDANSVVVEEEKEQEKEQEKEGRSTQKDRRKR